MRILFFYSSIIFSQILLANPSTQNILSQLLNIHGPNWHSTIKDSNDKLSVKRVLESIIKREVNLKKYGYNQIMQTEIRKNAIGEFGHFVESQNGLLNQNDRNIFQQILDEIDHDPHSHTALSYYYSLKNAGNPESLELLAKSLKTLDDPSVIYTVSSNIYEHLNGNENRKINLEADFSYITPFEPNLKTNFKKRKGNWSSSIVIAKQALREAEEKIISISRSQNFINTLQAQNKKTFALTNQESFQKVIEKQKLSHANKKTAKTSKTSNREIASEKRNRKTSFIKQYYIYVIALILIVILRRRLF